jgi:hypothetical protein
VADVTSSVPKPAVVISRRRVGEVRRESPDLVVRLGLVERQADAADPVAHIGPGGLEDGVDAVDRDAPNPKN